MIIYRTKILEEAAKEPTQLDIEKILYQRSRYHTSEDKYRLSRLEAGEKGEQLVLDYLEKYGKDDWIVIRNIWLNNNGPFEVDILLITSSTVYIFEIKNYSSHFVYEDGITKINNKIISGNPINQARRNAINLEGICKQYSTQLEVKGVLVLIGEDNYVEINSDVKGIDIIQRNQLKHYIKQIVNNREAHYKNSINIKYFLKNLEKYEIDRYYGPQNIKTEEIDELKQGIHCLHCKSFDVEINRKLIKCKCGFTEAREMAILRTICEYGVLIANKKLTIKRLEYFFGNEISRKSIQKVLRKYYKEVKNGSHSYFNNRNLPLHKLYKELNIEKKIQFSLTYEEYEKFRLNIY